MQISMMPSAELVNLLREFRNSLLGVARQSVGPAVQAAAGAAAKIDRLATETAAGKRTRDVIDREFSKILLSLADKHADVFAALLAAIPDLPDDVAEDLAGNEEETEIETRE
jgi:hypothetical protein